MNQREPRGDTRRLSIDLLRIVIAILLPPLGVFLRVGIGEQFWIRTIHGMVRAVWVIARG